LENFVELNLNNLVVALSHALDFMETDFLGVVSNHSKRVAYIALRTAERFGLSREELFDLVTLAILHDNGIGAAFHPQAGEEGREAVPFGLSGFSAMEKGELHCVAGEENIKGFPFLADAAGVIKYHHENYDGSGYFRLQGAAIPLKSQLIRLADLVELGSDLRGIDYEGKVALYALLERHSGAVLAPDLIEGFKEASSYPAFWLDLKDEFIADALHRRAPRFRTSMDWDGIRDVTAIFSRIIDSKSRFTRLHSQELSERAGRMGLRYRMDAPSIAEFRTAADLHDIGKLAVSNAILDKPGKLESSETDVIQRHTYYTRVSLESIEGFERITEWAANHHEKLDGTGYPYRKDASDLDFNSRLMACLDIYQALTELRPYREALSHRRAIEILNDMAAAGKIEASIVEDIDREFA
jgi:HD-GYP domain-containing protein (c-di-GMP phosphodiesterase class II)